MLFHYLSSPRYYTPFYSPRHCTSVRCALRPWPWRLPARCTPSSIKSRKHQLGQIIVEKRIVKLIIKTAKNYKNELYVIKMKKKGYNSYKTSIDQQIYQCLLFLFIGQIKTILDYQIQCLCTTRIEIMRKINHGFFNYTVPLELAISRWCSFSFNFMFF